MPSSASARRSIIIDGQSFKKNDTVTGNGTTTRKPNVAAAKTGSLSVRTDNDTGTIAAATGHGIVSTNVIDVFWAGGYRRSMTATVTGDNIAVDGGSGDNLPALNTTVTFKLPEVVSDVTITGANVTAYAVSAPVGGVVHFRTAADALIKAERIPEGGGSAFWDNLSGITNPLTGQTVGKIAFSHDDSTSVREMVAKLLHN